MLPAPRFCFLPPSLALLALATECHHHHYDVRTSDGHLFWLLSNGNDAFAKRTRNVRARVPYPLDPDGLRSGQSDPRRALL